VFSKRRLVASWRRSCHRRLGKSSSFAAVRNACPIARGVSIGSTVPSRIAPPSSGRRDRKARTALVLNGTRLGRSFLVRGRSICGCGPSRCTRLHVSVDSSACRTQLSTAMRTAAPSHFDCERSHASYNLSSSVFPSGSLRKSRRRSRPPSRLNFPLFMGARD
jgi:hypothetical protein